MAVIVPALRMSMTPPLILWPLPIYPSYSSFAALPAVRGHREPGADRCGHPAGMPSLVPLEGLEKTPAAAARFAITSCLTQGVFIA